MENLLIHKTDLVIIESNLSKAEIMNSYNKINLNALNKAFSILAFALILLNLGIIIVTSPAKSYEISIFDAYPSYYPFLLALPVSLGILILLLTSTFNNQSSYWKLGLSIIILGNIIILLLPLFRGYAFYGRADPLVHFGFLHDIFKTGYFGESNFYPLSHICVIIIYFISDMQLMRVMMLFPAFFNVIYILGLYLLGTTINKNHYGALIITAFGSVLLFTYFGSQFLPTAFSLMLIPLTLFLLIRSGDNNQNKVQYKILLILIIYFISIFHPVSIINLIVVFVIFWLYSIMLANFKTRIRELPSYSVSYSSILILIVCFITWFSQFSMFKGTTRIIGNWFLYQIGTPPVEVYGKRLGAVSLPLSDYINYILTGYSHELAYFLISSCFVAYLIYNTLRNRLNVITYELLFSLLFVIFSLSTLIVNFGSFMINNPQRQFLYSLMVSTILNGFAFCKLIKISQKKYILLAACILIPCSVVGVYSSYSSVLMGVVNSQVTYADLSGSSWFVSNANYDNRIIYSINNEFYRLIYATLGRDFENQSKIIKSSANAPSLFNISNLDPYYLALSDYARTKYTVYWPDSQDFPKEIIFLLQSSVGLNKIYDNHGETFFLHEPINISN